MQKKRSRALACILAMLVVLSTIPFMSVSAAALTYRTGANGPASTYKSSKYYTHVTSINLSGDGVTDTLAAALSQLGYYEGTSSNKYSGLYNTWDTYTSDKTTEYVYNYGDADSSGYRMAWCASFCSWALFQARVTDHSTHSQSCRNHIGESEYIWRECSCYQWADQLKRFNKYRARGSYTPKAGDLIFFKMDGGGSAWTNHIGLVRYCDGSTVYTVEGNRHNHVGLYSYSLSDSQICGYGVLPYPQNSSALKVDYSGKNKTAGQYITNNVTLGVSASKGGSASFTVGKYEMFDVTGFDGSYAVVNYKGSTGYATLNSNTIQVTATAASEKTQVTVYAPSGVSDFYAAGYGAISTSNNDLNPNIYIKGLREDCDKYKGLENYSTNKDKIMINGRTMTKWESRTGGAGINNVWIYGTGGGNAYLGFELADENILRLPGQTGCGEVLQTIVLKRGLEIPKANGNYWSSGELAEGSSNWVSTVGVLKENVVLVANSNGTFTVVTPGSASYNSYGYTFTEKTAQIVKLTADANIRKGPGTTYEPIGVGLEGAAYEYLDETQNTKWLKVDYNGQIGWISNVNASVVNVPQYVTVTDDVNIRSGPGSSYSILSIGLPGDTFEYLGEISGTFYKIRYNGQEAWMSKNFSTLGAAQKVMTVTVACNHSFTQKDTTYLKSEATYTSPAIYYKSCVICGAKGTETFEYGTDLTQAGEITQVLNGKKNAAYNIASLGEHSVELPDGFTAGLTYVYFVDTKTGKYILVASETTGEAVQFNAEREGVYAVVQVEAGDVNLDLELNVLDTVALLKMVSANDEATALNDVDGNDAFNTNDVLVAMKLILKLITPK